MKQQTAVEFLQSKYENSPEDILLQQDFEKAKVLEIMQEKEFGKWILSGDGAAYISRICAGGQGLNIDKIHESYIKHKKSKK